MIIIVLCAMSQFVGTQSYKFKDFCRKTERKPHKNITLLHFKKNTYLCTTYKIMLL